MSRTSLTADSPVVSQCGIPYSLILIPDSFRRLHILFLFVLKRLQCDSHLVWICGMLSIKARFRVQFMLPSFINVCALWRGLRAKAQFLIWDYDSAFYERLHCCQIQYHCYKISPCSPFSNGSNALNVPNWEFLYQVSVKVPRAPLLSNTQMW